MSAATAATARAALPVPAWLLETHLCPLPVLRATPASTGGSLLEIRTLLTHGDPEARGMGIAQELSVHLVFQISNVSFFLLSPALLYLNRQYCQKKAVPLYFVSGLLLLVGGCQCCEKTRQVARLPKMRPLEGVSGQSTGKTRVGNQATRSVRSLQPMIPASWGCAASSPVIPRGVTGLTQSSPLEHQNLCPALQ